MSETVILTAKPRTLREVSLEVAAGRKYASSMKEFVDVLIARSKAPETYTGHFSIPDDLVSEEPGNLDNPILSVHLAGMAEHIAMLGGFRPPEWCMKPKYFMVEPTKGNGTYRSEAVDDTPSAFRRRLLFCGPVLSKLFKRRPRPKP